MILNVCKRYLTRTQTGSLKPNKKYKDSEDDQYVYESSSFHPGDDEQPPPATPYTQSIERGYLILPRENKDPHSNNDESDDNDSPDDGNTCGSESGDSDDGFGVCVVCGGDGKDVSMQCGLCANWIHLKCWNKRFGNNEVHVPSGDIICTSYEQCKKEFDKLVSIGWIEAPPQLLDDEDDDKGDVREMDRLDDALEMLEQGISMPETGSSLNSMVFNLLEIKRDEPLKYESLQCWQKYSHGIDKASHEGQVEAFFTTMLKYGFHAPWFEEAKSRLKSHLPPRNILRVLESCIRKNTIKHEVLLKSLGGKNSGVHAKFELNYIDVIDAAFDLFCSYTLRRFGPTFSWKDLKQSTCGRLPFVEKVIRRFAQYESFDPDDPKNVTIPVILYEDDSRTKSGNVTVCPLWLTSALIDPACRAEHASDAHVLVSLLPVGSALEFVSDDGSECFVPITKRETLAKSLRLDALEEILGNITDNQSEGRPYVIEGRVVYVRVLLFSFCTDMKERRTVLSLMTNKYHCSHCYDFPGRPNIDERVSGLRTTKKDKKLRTLFSSQDVSHSHSTSQRGKSLTERFKEAHSTLGILRIDKCPLTRNPERAVFTQDGPYELFLPDLLHCKDGVTRRYMRMLISLLGESAIKVTQQFGNEFLETKRFAMHIMEKGIESAHFIPLALQFGEFDSELTSTDRTTLVKGACALLSIFGLLNDPAPLHVHDHLKSAVEQFRTSVEYLSAKTGVPITPKMHELFEHFSPTIRRVGSLRPFSAKLFETFHKDIIEEYSKSSRRIGHGRGNREVLIKFYYRRALREVEHLQNKEQMNDIRLEPHLSFRPEPRFRVKQAYVSNLTAVKHLHRNLGKIARKVFALNTTPDVSHDIIDNDQVSNFGDTLEMFLECPLRKSKASRTETAVVPDTSHGTFFSGGSFTCVAFANCQTPFKDKKNTCDCFVHSASIELFCSSERDNTSYTVPVLFGDDYLLGLSLNPPTHHTFPINNGSIQELECDWSRLIKVPYSVVRGVRMMRPHHEKRYRFNVFVFIFQDVFGYYGL